MPWAIRQLSSLIVVAIALAAMPGLANAAPVVVEGAAQVQTQVRPLNRIVEVHTKVVVRNVLPEAAQNLNIVVPPTVLNRAGTQRVLDVMFVAEPAATRQTLAGVEATYQVAEVPGFAHLTFEQIYTVELLGDARQVIEESIDARYLAAEAGIEAENVEIAAKALDVTRGLTSTAQKAAAIIEFVTDRITYDASAPSRNKGALAGFQTGIGVCQEYAGLFVAMARAGGIPARMVYGWARDTGLDGALNTSNRHVWAEYYDAGKGWVAVDPTFAETQADPLAFDAQNHIAQDWNNTSLTASFGGRGLLSVVANQTVIQLSTANR